MKNFILLLIVAVLVVSCKNNNNNSITTFGEEDTSRLNNVQRLEETRGELIYLPVFTSTEYKSKKKTIDFAVTMNIRNVDPYNNIVIKRTDFYDAEGRVIKKYFKKPLVVYPLQTKRIVVEPENRSVTNGTNFIVEWQGSKETCSPIVDAVMISSRLKDGITFRTEGKVVKQI